MGEILMLISKIISIIAVGVNAVSATVKVAKEAGLEFDALWKFLPDKWKL